MAKQEIDLVEVIADDDFSVPGGMVRKGEPCRCTRRKAKDLVGTGQAHYPTDEDRAALAGEQDDGEPDPEKNDATGEGSGDETAGGDGTTAETEQAKPASRSGARKASK